MDEINNTDQVEVVNQHLKEIPKEVRERTAGKQPQEGKNEKPIEPF